MELCNTGSSVDPRPALNWKNKNRSHCFHIYVVHEKNEKIAVFKAGAESNQNRASGAGYHNF